MPFAILPTYPEIVADPQAEATVLFPALDHPRCGGTPTALTSRTREPRIGRVHGFLLRCLVLTALALGLPVCGHAAVGWVVRPEPPAGARGGARCALESERQAVFDGYQETWAQIVVDGAAVRVTSGSVLDPGDRDIGLSVDGGAFVPADEVMGGRTAVFSARYRALIDDFRRGLHVRVQLRFWPTWPKTGTHAVSFGLIGFTRAHAGMLDCKAP